MKIVIGIVSWIPEEARGRALRIERINRLINKLSTCFKGLPIMLITQNWKDFSINRDNIIRLDYPQLGITKARQTLRKHFLESEFDYMITFDDDSIIEEKVPGACKKYLEEIEKHPDGFCFPNPGQSQLNGCAISKHIYSLEDMVDIHADKNEAFEDVVFCSLLMNKYPDSMFNFKDMQCVQHFKTNEQAPSTWATMDNKWGQLNNNTWTIVNYIKENKDIPNLRIFFEYGKLLDKSYSYEQYKEEEEKRILEEKKQKLRDILSKIPEGPARDIYKKSICKAWGVDI